MNGLKPEKLKKKIKIVGVTLDLQLISRANPALIHFVYRTRAIITRGLYTFYPILKFFKELFP